MDHAHHRVHQVDGLGILDRGGTCVPRGLDPRHRPLVRVVVMEEKYVLNGEEIDVSSFYYKGELSFHQPKQNYTITFNNKDGKQVGGFDFNGQTLAFIGEAEESAKLFIEWATAIFSARLKEEYQRGYEDCLTEEAKK